MPMELTVELGHGYLGSECLEVTLIPLAAYCPWQAVVFSVMVSAGSFAIIFRRQGSPPALCLLWQCLNPRLTDCHSQGT